MPCAKHYTVYWLNVFMNWTKGQLPGHVRQQMLLRLTELKRVTVFSDNAAQPEEVKREFSDLIPKMAEAACQLDRAHTGLHAWCAWRNAQAAARRAGLAALVDTMETGRH